MAVSAAINSDERFDGMFVAERLQRSLMRTSHSRHSVQGWYKIYPGQQLSRESPVQTAVLRGPKLSLARRRQFGQVKMARALVVLVVMRFDNLSSC